MDCPSLPEFVRASVALKTGAVEEKRAKKDALTRCRAAKEAIDRLFEENAEEGQTLCIEDGQYALYVRTKTFKGSRKLKEDDIREAVLPLQAEDRDAEAMRVAVLEALRAKAATERTRIVADKAPADPSARGVPNVKTVATPSAKMMAKNHREAAEARKAAHEALKSAQKAAKETIERTKEAVMAGLDSADGGSGFTEVPVCHGDGRYVLKLKQRRRATKSKTALRDIVAAAWDDAGVQVSRWEQVRDDFCARLQARMIVTSTKSDLSLDIDRSKKPEQAAET